MPGGRAASDVLYAAMRDTDCMLRLLVSVRLLWLVSWQQLMAPWPSRAEPVEGAVTADAELDLPGCAGRTLSVV